MKRHEWFARLCSATVRSMPDGAREALRSIPGLETPADPWRTPDLGPAVLASEIARRYADGHHPDDIDAWFTRVELGPAGGAADEVIAAVCESYRRSALPFSRWWRPDELTATLLRWYARWRLAGGGMDLVVPELLYRWELSEDDTSELLVNATSEIVGAPEIFIEPGHDAPSRWLRKVAASKEIRTKVDAALTRYAAALRERDDLLAMARYRETHAAIAERLAGTSGTGDPVVVAAVERLNDAIEDSSSVLLSLGSYERRLLEPEGELESKFARAMEIRRHTFRLDDTWGGVNTLPDQRQGEWRSTAWLEDYVYHQGGRILRKSAGPIAHWTLVLDDMVDGSAVADLLANPDYEPGVRLVETSGLGLQLQIDDDPSDPMIAEFFYDDTPEGLLDLVVLVQTRRARLDVFVLGDGALSGVGSRCIPVDQSDLVRILDWLEPRVDALLADAKVTERTRIGVDYADHWAIVAAIDAAKSADLLAALDPELIAGVKRLDSKRRDAFHTARRALLDALAAGVGRDVSGEPAAAELVDAARKTYAHTVQQLRAPGEAGQPPDRDDRALVNGLVDGLVDDRRAVVTLTLVRSLWDGSTRVRGYWVSGAGSSRSVGGSEDSAVSLEQLRNAVPLPLQEPKDLDALIAASPTLVYDIVAPLVAQGVRELTVVPVSFLHALPLHLWPATADPQGPRLCDLFEVISYAPSLALLQRLMRLPVRSSGTIVAAAHGADLAFVNAETTILSMLAGDRARLLPSATKHALATEAASAGLLHLACHGSWIIGDYWGSGLALDGADEVERWLSVAEIQKTLDLEGASLVCLSACESGVSTSDLWRVDDYLGIDGAFLACGARAVVSSMWNVDDAVAFLFGATMYHALSTGSSIAQAHRAAVSMFADRTYRTIDKHHPLSFLLKLAGVDWVEEVRVMDDSGVDPSHPFYWGVFKLSGLTHDHVRLKSG